MPRPRCPRPDVGTAGPGAAPVGDPASWLRRALARDDATHYEILGLAPDAAPEALREQFRQLMQLIHPDRRDARAAWPEEAAARVNRAYSVLKSPATRAAYDRQLAARRPRAAPRATAFGGSRSSSVASDRAPSLAERLGVGLGECLRAHPAAMSLAAIAAVSASIIAALAWEGRETMLTRDAAPRAAAPRTETAHATAALPETARAADAPARTEAPVAERVRAVGSPAAASAKPAVLARAAVAAVRDERTGSVPVPVDSVMGRERSAEPAAAPVVAATPPAPDPPLAIVAAVAAAPPPATAEIEAFFAAFVESYERGRADAIAALFDEDADANLRRGRDAIRGEYDELFRQSSWRRMQLTRIHWRRAGDRAHAKGEISVRIGWRDGREIEQRLAVDMELVRRDGRAVIARLDQQPRH